MKLTPEQRAERARQEADAYAAYIEAEVARAPRMSEAQMDRIASIFMSVPWHPASATPGA